MKTTIVLSGAEVVVPAGILSPGTVFIEDSRIVDVVSGARAAGGVDRHFDLAGHYLVPGFIDVHIHGVEGFDTQQDGDPIAEIARRLPRYGVTAFCPTSLACDPPTLRRMLEGVRRARTNPVAGARVLPAHLESNFINPEYKGAQPIECLRSPRGGGPAGEFTGEHILEEIAASRPDVGILTVAPELDGALPLIADLVAHGHYVSLGHSGATYEQAVAGIEAGASQATHLFNRMPPVAHRAPGLAGAVLGHDGVAAEVVCDGVHVHPAMVRVALAAKGPDRFMAITDGTAGSAITMNRAFANLVQIVGASLPEAAAACATTQARELGLHGLGVIAAGAFADLVVLDRDLRVSRTFVDGRLAWPG